MNVIYFPHKFRTIAKLVLMTLVITFDIYIQLTYVTQKKTIMTLFFVLPGDKLFDLYHPQVKYIIA